MAGGLAGLTAGCATAENGAASRAVSASWHAAPSENDAPRALAAAFPLSP
jgi:hypothetical protein